MFNISKTGSEVEVTLKNEIVYFDQIPSLNGYNILYIEKASQGKVPHPKTVTARNTANMKNTFNREKN